MVISNKKLDKTMVNSKKTLDKAGKNRKTRKNEGDDNGQRELIFKEPGQEYAHVLRMLGDSRCDALCMDGVTRLCHIRGKLRNKVWIGEGDLVLVGLRDYQNYKADIILKYTSEEARLLKEFKELPENFRLDEDDDYPDHDRFDFVDEEIHNI